MSTEEEELAILGKGSGPCSFFISYAETVIRRTGGWHKFFYTHYCLQPIIMFTHYDFILTNLSLKW